ncbi:MAG: ABC transporter ATP-binding protein [Clostridiales bacterium]|nr:ABC transporter ATP-binding protein [Clostridiales bacterium]
MIALKNVSKTYGKGNTKAVDDATLTVDRGTLFGFIGPNGAGKTTTIKMMTGVIAPDHGEILIDNTSMRSEGIQAKKKIGYVADNSPLPERIKGIEYLSFLADMYNVGNEERKEHIEKYSAYFELSHALRDYIGSYSRGMKQKLAIIGALIHKPKLWVLDEPMVGLDPKASHLLKEEMRNHCNQGNTVFFSTHVLEVAENLCDEIAVIAKGKLIAKDTMENLKNQAKGTTLEEVFLSLTQEDKEGSK